jgi:hypothetical protein
MSASKVCIPGYRPDIAPGVRVVCIGTKPPNQSLDWKLRGCLAEGIARKRGMLTRPEIRFLVEHYGSDSVKEMESSIATQIVARQLVLRKLGKSAIDPMYLYELVGSSARDHEYVIDTDSLDGPRLVGDYVSTFEIPT